MEATALEVENNNLKIKLQDLEASPTKKDKQIRNLLKEIRYLEKRLKEAEKKTFETEYRELQKKYKTQWVELMELRDRVNEPPEPLSLGQRIKAVFTGG